jgi:hypothetical protein
MIFLKISFILSLLKDKFKLYCIIKKTFSSFFISHKRQISRFLKSLNVAEIKCIHANGNTDSQTEYLKTSTKTKKSIFLTFITTYGLTNNEYYRQLVQNSLSLDDLFLDLCEPKLLFF